MKFVGEMNAGGSGVPTARLLMTTTVGLNLLYLVLDEKLCGLPPLGRVSGPLMFSNLWPVGRGASIPRECLCVNKDLLPERATKRHKNHKGSKTIFLSTTLVRFASFCGLIMPSLNERKRTCNDS